MADKPKPCRWVEDDNGAYATGCRRYFEVHEDTPEDNGFAFCCYCGVHDFHIGPKGESK